MTNTKNTKRALLASVMAMLLCFTMLLGTTYAWFTDSVTSAGNKIVSGTFDVDLYLWNSATEPVEITETSAPIFGADSLVAQNNAADTLWEPGKTQVVYLSIKNNGNLDLKYKVAIEVTNVEKNIIDVLYYTITPDEKWSATPVAWDDTNAKQVVNGTNVDAADVMLQAAQEHFFALSVHMDEEAGNDYQGASVTFDIKVLATQVDSESDSFDNQYDANLDAMTNGISRTLDDGSTAFYYGEDSGYYGRVRLTELPENIGSEYVVPAEVNDLGGALTGVTLDKLTIPAGVAYAYKSLEGATIDEVVIEEGATTIPNRMFYRTNVASIVIPSSVTVIEENAFAQTAVVEELVIPASVTTVEEAAFQHMTNLTTVTFEGNTAIQGYAFRGCSALRTVYLKGDDVTFVPSTLNNRNSCWFCNGESNNPGTSTITFYVQNATMATRVHGMMGADVTTITVVVDGEEVTVVKNDTELTTAIASGGNIILAADVSGVDANTAITVASGADVTLDLNGHKITATANKTGNQELFLVKGTMTVKNGSLELTAENNQEWEAMATIFDVTAGGVLKVDGVTANVAGTDMNFFVHLNNWGSATLEMTNCDITTSYVAVRAFNSGYDMNTVTIKETDFHNGRMFWVHNFTAEGKDASTLTLDIYDNNTSDNAKPVRFGFSDSVYYDINGNLIP